MKRLLVGLLALISAGSLIAYTVENKTRSAIKVKEVYIGDDSARMTTVPAYRVWDEKKDSYIFSGSQELGHMEFWYESEPNLRRTIYDVEANDKIVITGDGESTIFAKKQ